MKGYETECPRCNYVAFERTQQAANRMIELHLSAVHKLYGTHGRKALDGETS